MSSQISFDYSFLISGKAMGRNKYTLTKKDRRILCEGGVKEEELEQIQEGIDNVVITRYEPGRTSIKHPRQIGIRTAIKHVGKIGFLWSMHRAAFHWTSANESLDGRWEIGFDLNDWWREQLK